MLIAAYFFIGTEHTAVAIVVALLVGLGVRAMVATKGHPSYARGVLTALIAMATFLGGKYIVVEIASAAGGQQFDFDSRQRPQRRPSSMICPR